MFHRKADFSVKVPAHRVRHNSRDCSADGAATQRAAGGLEIHHPGGRAPAARRARGAVAATSARVSRQAVAAAAAQGDRSENAEYTYGKRRLREIDRRVRFLRRAARRHGRRGPPAGGCAARILRRLGAARERRTGGAAATASSGRTSSTWPPATSAWTRRSGARCWASALDEEVVVETPDRQPRLPHRGDRVPALGGRRQRAAVRLPRRCYQMTRTFLNCHGSLLSMSSGNSRSRSCSGVQSVYSPTTGPR